MPFQGEVMNDAEHINKDEKLRPERAKSHSPMASAASPWDNDSEQNKQYVYLLSQAKHM